MSTLKNTVINDTGHITVAVGTTAQRPSSPTQGMIRYNTTNGNLETYTVNNNWGGLEPPPQITSITGVINVDTNSTITINGANFVSGAVVTIGGAATSNTPRTLTTTFVSSTQLTAATNAAAVNYVGAASYDITVTNPSGNSTAQLAVALIDRDPTWVTSAGALGNIYDSSRTGRSFTVAASDADGNTISYAVTSGSLPPNMSLSSSGVISGTTNSVGTDTTYSFGITPTANGFNGVERSFSITVKAPIVQSFTAVGSTTFSVPVGVTTARVVVVAGGGAGGTRNAGYNGSGTDGGAGGGAGGMIDHPAYTLNPGGSVTVTVGAGAPQNYSAPQAQGSNGSNSVFDALTAIGGGGGGAGPGGAVAQGLNGGSGGGFGGGGTTNAGGWNSSYAVGTQPAQPGASGTYGYGYPGGNNTNVSPYTGGGGGGAGGAGSPAGSGNVGNAGSGRATTISGSPVYYAGGGGGAAFAASPQTSQGSGGTGGGGAGGDPGNGQGRDGSTNTGGGGGGGCGQPAPSGAGGAGGPGIVIIRY